MSDEQNDLIKFQQAFQNKTEEQLFELFDFKYYENDNKEETIEIILQIISCYPSMFKEPRKFLEYFFNDKSISKCDINELFFLIENESLKILESDYRLFCPILEFVLDKKIGGDYSRFITKLETAKNKFPKNGIDNMIAIFQYKTSYYCVIM